MTIKTYFLSEDKTVYLKAYMLDNVEGLPFCEKRPGILILPGGGYEFCSAREGEPVAMHYLAEGYNAFVLIYSCNARHPAPLLNASYAILKLRQRCEEFGIDPNKLAVWGASAGGHLAACLGTMWSGDMVATFAKEYLGCEKEYVRPDGLLLGYPVITAGKNAHRGSFVKLLGDNYDKYIEDISVENKVSKDTPESFVWHTFDDNSVSLENSLLFVEALRKNGVKFEYHVFPDGCHGLGLGTKETAT